jgi:hypothetical protein
VVGSAIFRGIPALLAVALAGVASAQEVPSSVRVQFLPPDARSRGLGGAYVAIADDALATFWNPGALGLVSGKSLLPFAWTRPLPQEGDDGWQYTGAVAFGSDGFGGGLHVSYLSHGERSVGGPSPVTWTPSEWIAHFGFGIDLARIWLHGLEPLRWGVGGSLKLVRSYRFPAYEGASELSATMFDMDVGTLLALRLPLRDAPPDARPSHLELRAGATVRNVKDHQFNYGDGGTKEPLGGGPRIGAAAELALFDQGTLGHWIRATGSYDLEYFREYRNTAAAPDPPQLESGWFEYADPIRHAGVEVEVLGILAGRVGHVDGPGGFSGNTVGAGIGAGRTFRARLDWARWPSVDDMFDDIDVWSLITSTDF